MEVDTTNVAPQIKPTEASTQNIEVGNQESNAQLITPVPNSGNDTDFNTIPVNKESKPSKKPKKRKPRIPRDMTAPRQPLTGIYVSYFIA